MKIDDDHLYHGAALIQIAEHPNFTAINSLREPRVSLRNTFLINDRIKVYLKYATKSKGKLAEYCFSFKKDHLKELAIIAGIHPQNLFISLVCVKGREICCIRYMELMELVHARREDAGKEEEQYTILVTLPRKMNFRVYVNAHGTKNRYCSEPIKIPRNFFPNCLFQ